MDVDCRSRRLGNFRPSFIEMVFQTLIRFPKGLKPYGRAFLIGVVCGWCLSYRAPSKLDEALEYAKTRTKQILQEHKSSAEEGRNIVDQLRHGGAASAIRRGTGID